MTNEEMLLIAVLVWLVSFVLALVIFLFDDRIKPENYIKTLVIASLPVVNTVFVVLHNIVGWLKK